MLTLHPEVIDRISLNKIVGYCFLSMGAASHLSTWHKGTFNSEMKDNLNFSFKGIKNISGFLMGEMWSIKKFFV